MSEENNPSIFSRQMEAVFFYVYSGNVFVILQILFTTRLVLKIEEYTSKISQF